MLTRLTSKQREVCDFIVQGMTNKEISVRMGISHRTVEDHRHCTFKKLGVHNAAQLVRKVLLEGRPA